MKKVCFINMKGGVGKTTLAVNVAYVLSKQFSKRVLLVDLDPQMNATQYTLTESKVQNILNEPNSTICGVFTNDISYVMRKDKEAQPKTIRYKVASNFDIIGSHLSLMQTNIDGSPLLLKKYLSEREITTNYDIVIIDAPPTMSSFTRAALLASDIYIVPMKPDYLSLFGLPLLQNYVDSLQSEYEHKIDFGGIVLSMVDPRFKIYKSVKHELQNVSLWRDNLFTSELSYRTKVANALSNEDSFQKTRENSFIYSLGDAQLKTEIVNITSELMQKIRL